MGGGGQRRGHAHDQRRRDVDPHAEHHERPAPRARACWTTARPCRRRARRGGDRPHVAPAATPPVAGISARRHPRPRSTTSRSATPTPGSSARGQPAAAHHQRRRELELDGRRRPRHHAVGRLVRGPEHRHLVGSGGLVLRSTNGGATGRRSRAEPAASSASWRSRAPRSGARWGRAARSSAPPTAARRGTRSRTPRLGPPCTAWPSATPTPGSASATGRIRARADGRGHRADHQRRRHVDHRLEHDGVHVRRRVRTPTVAVVVAASGGFFATRSADGGATWTWCLPRPRHRAITACASSRRPRAMRSARAAPWPGRPTRGRTGSSSRPRSCRHRWRRPRQDRAFAGARSVRARRRSRRPICTARPRARARASSSVGASGTALRRDTQATTAVGGPPARALSLARARADRAQPDAPRRDDRFRARLGRPRARADLLRDRRRGRDPRRRRLHRRPPHASLEDPARGERDLLRHGGSREPACVA